MRLTPGLFVVLVIAALVFFAIPIAGSSTSCGEADEQFENDLTGAAEKAYLAILADDPDSKCAAAGMSEVIHRRCYEAGLLLSDDRLLEEAEAAYLKLLTTETPTTPRNAARACALSALPNARKRLKAQEDSGDQGQAGGTSG